MRAMTRRSGSGRLRSTPQWIPMLYVMLALLLAAVFLPSILRPPPEQSTDAAAFNPNAPPDDQSEQLIQSTQQAKGGGAGALAGTGPQVGQGTAPPSTTTTIPPVRPKSFSQCFGNPPRQSESIYSAPCAPAFSGDNGGATGHNVLPNEIRLGFYHSVGAPPEGPVSDTPPTNESSQQRTFRVLQAYFNAHYQTYGRRIQFYGLTGSEDPAVSTAEADKADTQYQIFGAYHLNLPFCETMIRRGGVMICNPQEHAVYTRNRPGFFSWMMEYEQAQAFGSEFMCKDIIGKPVKFAGPGISGDRKLAWIGEYDANDGVPASTFTGALKKECGATVDGGTFEVKSQNEAAASQAAIAQMKNAGVTTVVLNIGVVNAAYAMSAADSLGWQPEWIIFSDFGMDFNIIGNLLPKSQSQHLFGFSGWEIPRPPPQTECYEAYRSIDPSNTPDSSSCGNFWHPMVLLMDGIQEAGPKLDQKSFDDALMRLGHRYPDVPWGVGGGFGPDDYSYMDNVGLIWFDQNAIDPGTGGPGAYRWMFKGTRFKRGEIPADDSQLFKRGVNSPGAPDG